MSVAAEYRADRAVLNTLAYAEHDLLGSKFLTHNKLVEQLLACLGNRLLDSLAQTFESVAHVGKRGLLNGAVCGILVCLVIKKVYIYICLTVYNIRNNHRTNRGSEGRFQILKYTVKTRVLVAKSVYEENLCQACFVGSLNSLFCSYAYSVLARYNDQRGVGSSHALGNSAGKVEQSGCVNKIDLGILPLDWRNRCHNGNLSFDLLAVKIQRGVSVRDISQSVACLGKIENALSNRCFTAAAVTGERDIMDSLCVILFQW